jgi:hypothetical protein
MHAHGDVGSMQMESTRRGSRGMPQFTPQGIGKSEHNRLLFIDVGTQYARLQTSHRLRERKCGQV